MEVVNHTSLKLENFLLEDGIKKITNGLVYNKIYDYIQISGACIDPFLF